MMTRLKPCKTLIFIQKPSKGRLYRFIILTYQFISLMMQLAYETKEFVLKFDIVLKV